MASYFNDLSQVLVPLKDTFPPQLLSATGDGNAIFVGDVGTNLINARLSWGTATALTSLAVKMQASPTGSGSWVDITDADGDTVAFTTVTAASGTPQTISFQMPPSLTATSDPYLYVRASATLVGTSIQMAVSLLGCAKFGGGGTGYQNTPPANN